MSELPASIMDPSGKIKYLSECLDARINAFDARSANNKKKSFLIKMSTTSVSAATTVLLGLHGFEGHGIFHFDAMTVVKNIALVLSAFVTLFGAWDAFFDHRTLWINYVESANQLKAIREDLRYLTAGGTQSLDIEKVDRLHARYQSVLDSTNRRWGKLRDEKPTKPINRR